MQLCTGQDRGRVHAHLAGLGLVTRLADSPACFVAAENSMDMQLSKILKASGQDAGPDKRILEINPGHPLVMALNAEVQAQAGSSKAEQVAELLFDMALIVEGEAPRDAAGFAKSMTALMSNSLSA